MNTYSSSRMLRSPHVFALLLVMALGVSTAAAAVDIPGEEQLVDRVRSAHPRLLFREGDFADLRRRVEQSDRLSQWADHLREDAESILDKSAVEYRIPDGKRLLSVSRRLLHRVRILALLYRLDGNDKYLQGAWRELKAASQFKDWNPSHFLDTAEMTHGFALGYDWLYPDLTETQRRTIREAIIEMGLKPGLNSYRGEAGYGWWTDAHHNWNQVCNGGMSMGALAICHEKPGVAGEILRSALLSFRRPMERYAPDGGWAEGPGYWHYATRYTVNLLAALKSAMGTDFGFAEYEGFPRTGEFPIYITGPTDRTLNFADGGSGAIRAPEMFWLARRFDRPVFTWYQLRHAQPSPMDLIFYRGGKATRASEVLPKAALFRGPQVATMRTAWEDEDAAFVGLKAGRPYDNHGHADVGSFVLDSQGERWALDLGADDYNMPGYFSRGGDRWRYYRLRAEGHNTLVLNPGEGPGQRVKPTAKVTRFSREGPGAFAITDMSPSYADDADSLKRGIRLRGNGTVVVQDELDAPEPVEVWWFMHTRAEIEVADDGRSALLKRGGEELKAVIASPSGAEFEVLPAQPLPGSPDPDMQADNDGVKKLCINLHDARELTMAVVLAPADRAPAKADIRPLEQW